MKNKKSITEYPLGLVLTGLAIILFILMVLSVCIGKYEITPGEVLQILFRATFGLEQVADDMTVNVVLRLRLPRILASIFVGAALSASGTAYQGIFQNPLVSPDFLGVSSGACIGAASAILLGFASAGISVFAFVGGVVAVIITATLPKVLKNRSNIMLVLSGIIIGSLMSSILGFLKFVADPATELAAITYWTMGNFAYVLTTDLLPMVLILVPPMIVLIMMSWWLDVLSMGEDEAKSLGAGVKVIKAISIACSTLLTAGSVCISGTIGWVGLVIPHFSRMLVGTSNRRLMPASCLLGGAFMLVVDTLTRIIGANEMPVSIMTGLVGAPFFCWLLWKRRENIA